MTESRALQIFLEAIKTEATKTAYIYWLNKYMEWRQARSYEELVQDSLQNVQRHLEDYLLEIKEKQTPRGTIEAMLYPLFLFYQMNDFIINTKKIKKLFPSQIKKVGGQAYQTKQVAKILVTLGRKHKLKAFRNKAIIHFIAASGCRVGAIPDITLDHIRKVKNSYYVKIYAGTNSEYVTFLTPEASQSLDRFLQKRKELGHNLTPNSKLFDIKYSALRAMITRTVKKSQVVNKQPNGRFDIPSAHGLRKRWNTQLKQVDAINPILIEKIFGHNVIALDQNYLKPTPERLHEEYRKGEKVLTIFKDYNKTQDETVRLQ